MRTFYEKRGRRYYPVKEYEGALWKALPEGTHLIIKEIGKESIHYNIDPDYASLLAAIIKMKEEMCKALYEASKAKEPSSLSEEEKELWNKLDDLAELHFIRFPSTYEIIDRWVDIIKKHMGKDHDQATV